MEDPEDDDGRGFDAIHDDVGRSDDDEFAGAGNASLPGREDPVVCYPLDAVISRFLEGLLNLAAEPCIVLLGPVPPSRRLTHEHPKELGGRTVLSRGKAVRRSAL